MLKKYKPITPSLRHRVIVDRSDLDKVIVEKQLKGKLTKNGGRNKTGRITCRHRGGGHKRSIRYIDLTNKQKNNLVVTNEYDPNRTCYISRCYNNVFKCSYILSPITKGINKTSQLKDLKLGTSVYNIQGKYCRSGGSFGKIVKHEGSNTIIRLPSKHLIEVNSEEYVKEGKGSNHLNKFTTYQSFRCVNFFIIRAYNRNIFKYFFEIIWSDGVKNKNGLNCRVCF